MAKTISKTTISIAILAILSGLVAAYGIRAYLSQEKPVAPPPPHAPPPRTVPLAGTDLPAGRLVSPGDIVLTSMSREEYVELSRRYAGKLIMQTPQSVLHRRLKGAVAQGRPFLSSDLYLQGTGPSLSDQLQPGYRAIPLRVPQTHEGRVQPGDWVDIVFRVQPRPAKSGQPAIPEKTVTLLEHLEVLEIVGPPGPDATASGRRGTTPQAGFSVVTLAVPTEQSDVLAAVDGRGELWLVTSPDNRVGQAAAPAGAVPKPATLAELLGIQPPVPPFETAIYRRGRVQINRFVDGTLVGQTGIPNADAGNPNKDLGKDMGKELGKDAGKGATPVERVPAGVRPGHGPGDSAAKPEHSDGPFHEELPQDSP